MFKCKACGYSFEDKKSTNPICPRCGSNDVELKKSSRLVFVHRESGNYCSFHNPGAYGRDSFTLFPDYEYISPVQFYLKKENNKWYIKGDGSAVNPAYLNGTDITNKWVEIVENAELFIGNYNKKIGIRLTIKIE